MLQRVPEKWLHCTQMHWYLDTKVKWRGGGILGGTWYNGDCSWSTVAPLAYMGMYFLLCFSSTLKVFGVLMLWGHLSSVVSIFHFISFRFHCEVVCPLYFLQPKIDKDSLESLSTECPRIIVNPKPSPFGYKGIEVPRGALPNMALDDPVVKDVNPNTWAVTGLTARVTSASLSSPADLPMAEKFRLAFVERDTRLAPKRAKNARQQQRRAEREWVTRNTSAKAIALASNMSKSLHNKS